MAKMTINQLNEKVDKYYNNICEEFTKIIEKQNTLSDNIKKNNTDINNILDRLNNQNSDYKDYEKLNANISMINDKLKKIKDKNNELEHSLNVITDNLIKTINDIKFLNNKFEDNKKGKLSTLKNLINDISEIVNKSE